MSGAPFREPRRARTRSAARAAKASFSELECHPEHRATGLSRKGGPASRPAPTVSVLCAWYWTVLNVHGGGQHGAIGVGIGG